MNWLLVFLQPACETCGMSGHTSTLPYLLCHLLPRPSFPPSQQDAVQSQAVSHLSDTKHNLALRDGACIFKANGNFSADLGRDRIKPFGSVTWLCCLQWRVSKKFGTFLSSEMGKMSWVSETPHWKLWVFNLSLLNICLSFKYWVWEFIIFTV